MREPRAGNPVCHRHVDSCRGGTSRKARHRGERLVGRPCRL